MGGGRLCERCKTQSERQETRLPMERRRMLFLVQEEELMQHTKVEIHLFCKKLRTTKRISG